MAARATTSGARPKAGAPGATPQAGGRAENAAHDGPERGKAMPPDVPAGLADVLTARIDAISQMQAEMARFGAARMHHALEARTKMTCCRSLGEMQAVQAAYLRDMMADYAQEWGRLLEHGMRTGLGQPMPSPDAPPIERHATPV